MLMLFKSKSKPVINPIWLVLWSALFSITWLLPINFPPWTTFPADAWSALLLGVIGLFVVFRVRALVCWYSMSGLMALLVFLPWVQFSFGLIPYLGQAWISSAYLLGFLFALLIGAYWEKNSPYQLAHGFFIAIGIASILSVGLQLYTWLRLWESGLLGIWSLAQVGSRPSANLGQPNQLATLLMWGVLSFFWAYAHRVIGATTAILGTQFLLLGLALTQSRTGLLSATILLLAIFFWRRLWVSKNFILTASVLYAYFLICPTFLGQLSNSLMLGQDDVYFRLQQSKELRLNAWYLFGQAILERPWSGYGWTEVSVAQIAVAERFSTLGGVFTHSHNIFLDLMLWAGLPIGLFLTFFIILWFFLKFRAINKSGDAILFLLLVVLGIHSMFEFPFQYAYFLLPAGLVMGLLDSRLKSFFVYATPRWVLICVGVIAMMTLCITIRDYARVDESYSLLRLEQSPLGEGRAPMGTAPDTLVLNQLREWIKLSRSKPHSKMSTEEISEFVEITTYYPSLSFSYRLAISLALNGREGEALTWLKKICKITDEKGCALARRSWEQDSKQDPRIAAITWPN